jgi:hypothetical protein
VTNRISNAPAKNTGLVTTMTVQNRADRSRNMPRI